MSVGQFVEVAARWDWHALGQAQPRIRMGLTVTDGSSLRKGGGLAPAAGIDKVLTLSPSLTGPAVPVQGLNGCYSSISGVYAPKSYQPPKISPTL